MARAETVRSGRLGKRELRLVRKDGLFHGLADGVVLTQGDDADTVWVHLHDEIGKGDPRYFGFEGARSRFLKFFPNGFHSQGFERERHYKVEAARRLRLAAPLDEAVSASGLGAAVLAACRTNLLSPFEQMRVQDLLRSDDADAFIAAAARFALDPDKSNLLAMASICRRHGCAQWTVFSYLPFLWEPANHMFLKPEVTKEFAARVGHAFADNYASQPDIEVYRSLLDLATVTRAAIAELEPRDGIDVQSFIWVVGKYLDSDGLYP